MPIASRPAPFLAAAAFVLSPLTGQGFVDVTTSSGIQHVPPSTGGDGTGLCCADFDGDGDLDIAAPGLGLQVQYFRNDGGMNFTRVTTGTGLGASINPRSAIAADVDNDGDQDLLVTNWQAPLQLFINAGNATFNDEAGPRGLLSMTSVHGASFGDYDRDGWLDLYLSNRTLSGTSTGEPNTLYRGTGNGYFTDVSVATGTDHVGLTYAAPFFDYDEDGWPDIFIANDKGVLGVPNEVLRNQGDGTFSPVGMMINAAQVVDGMSVDFVDVFNDGGFDVYVTDSPIDHLFLRWNPNTGKYIEDTYTYAMLGAGVGWAANWFDYDNDGWQDLHVVHNGTPNHLLRNPGTPAAAQTPWTENGLALGLNQFELQFSAAVADLDDDGHVDVINRYALHPFFPNNPGITLHRNQVPGGNWIRFVMQGVVSNRDGIGAKIELVTGNLRQRQFVRNGTGYLSGSDPRPHFGLGTHAQVDLVEITWPSGQVQQLQNLAVNQVVEVVEPSFLLTAPATVGGTTTLELDIENDAGLLYGMVMSFSATPQSQLPDGRFLPLQLDALSSYTLIPGNIFLSNPLGFLDANGQATSLLTMPNQPGLAGLTLYATAATVGPTGFPDVRTIFPTAVRIDIQ